LKSANFNSVLVHDNDIVHIKDKNGQIYAIVPLGRYDRRIYIVAVNMAY